MTDSPEIGRSVRTGDIATNLHDVGSGVPILLLHGSGPGVTAWANWRLTIPVLSQRFRVIAPDLLGFGYTERRENPEYTMEAWSAHALSVLDALDIDRAHVVGNSFGGSLALYLGIHHPQRVRRLVIMGGVGVPFEITEGLDRVWGYQPSLENMKQILPLFAYNQDLLGDDLAQLRYEASIRPGFQESFSQMFPEPRQRALDAMTHNEDDIASITAPTMMVHGREDQVIPTYTSKRMFELIDNAELHIFGRCGHWTQIEYADRFCDLVGDFFAADGE